MRLELSQLPHNMVRPDPEYGSDTFSKGNRRLAPTAARAYLTDLHPAGVTVTDMWRSARGSMRAVAKGRGAKRPGYSGHNYGLSIDIGVTTTMKNMGLRTKRELDGWMASRGWVCWRKDHKRDIEEWHYDYGTLSYVDRDERNNANAVERLIRFYHADQFKIPTVKAVQAALKKASLIYLSNAADVKNEHDRARAAAIALSLDPGPVDGIAGKRTESALRAFQTSVGFTPTGRCGPPTQRVLSFVTAEIVLVPVPGWNTEPELTL